MISITKPRVRIQQQNIYTAEGEIKFRLFWNRKARSRCHIQQHRESIPLGERILYLPGLRHQSRSDRCLWLSSLKS